MKLRIALLQLLPGDSLEKQFQIGKEAIQKFSRLAAELQMAIGITFLERHDPKPLNSIILFDRSGKEVLHYAKVYTCAFDMEKCYHLAKTSLSQI